MQRQANFTIKANGKDVSQKLLDKVISLELIEYSGFIADHCIIQLDDHPNQRYTPPQAGDILNIALGYKEDAKLIDKGSFEIAEYSYNGPTETITFFANRLNWSTSLKSPVQRSWQSTEQKPLKLSALVNTIAAKHQLSAQIDADFQSIILPAIEQSESDLQLVTKLAAQYDATARIANKQLAFVKRSGEYSASGKPLGTTALSKQQLLSWQMMQSQGPSFNSCKAYYYDTINAKRKTVTVGSGEPCFELSLPLANLQTAKWAATARLQDFKRSTKTLSGQCIGQPTLSAGTKIDVQSIRKGIDGAWSLTKVHHKINNQGYSCQFEAEELSTA